MSALSNLMSKKLGPVPVIYIAAGLVAILGVVAWRMKPASTGDEEAAASETGDATLDENGLSDGSSPYAGYGSNGTVIVQPAPPSESVDRPVDNDAWVRQGAEWLAATKAVSPVAAFDALTKFIKGQSRSIGEAQWVEWVIKEIGFPPDPYPDGPLPTDPPVTPPTPSTKPGTGHTVGKGPRLPDEGPLLNTRPRPGAPGTRPNVPVTIPVNPGPRPVAR